MPTEILIFGAGAVGAFYGSRLAVAANTNVSVVCRSNYAAVKADGFSLTSPQFGAWQWAPTRTFANAREAQQSGVAWDYIVVTTKALPDVSDDSALLEGLVRECSTAIVLVQNGLGVEEPYRARFGRATILSGVTVVSADQPEHGRIRHQRWTRINVGPYLPSVRPLSPSASSPSTSTPSSSAPAPNPAAAEDDAAAAAAPARNARFVALLTAGGIADAIADTHAKLQLVRWHKIAINASMNPSSVLTGGATNAEMAFDRDLYPHLRGVMREVLEVAPKVLLSGAAGDGGDREALDLAGFATPEALLRSTRKDTSGSRPSMWGDWAQGKPMELEVILGNPIRIAREAGYEMPRMQTLYALLKMAQRKQAEGRQSKL